MPVVVESAASRSPAGRRWAARRRATSASVMSALSAAAGAAHTSAAASAARHRPQSACASCGTGERLTCGRDLGLRRGVEELAPREAERAARRSRPGNCWISVL